MRTTHVAAALIVAYAGTAGAQQGIDEIIVTAKNRTERLQDVPLAISAFSSDALVRSQILDVRDLQRLTPTFNAFSSTGRADPTALSMRGIAPNTSDERYQGVSFFMDGIPLSGQTFSISLANLERVEVIRGPQSATFGRATYSGAINYVTREPSGDEITGVFRSNVTDTKGGPGLSYQIGGLISFPIVSDRLWGGVEFVRDTNSALFKDIDAGNKIGEENTTSGAATLVWQATDNLKIKTRVAYDYDRDSVPAIVIQHAREWRLAGVPTVRLPRAGGALWPTYVPDPEPGITIAGDRSSQIYQPEGGNTRDRYSASGIITYDLDGTELSYRGGYVYSKDGKVLSQAKRSLLPNVDPVFGAPLAANQVTIAATAARLATAREEYRNNSHQVMVLSPSSEDLRWRFGANYFYETDINWQNGFVTAANPRGRQKGDEYVRNIAGFGGIDWDVTEQIVLSGEARYARETVGWNACTFCGQVTTVNNAQKDNDFLPRVTATYKFTENNMAYALYSKGTKSGRLSFVAGQPNLFYADPEKLDNYEIGTKNVFLDGRAVLNIAAFWQDIRAQQLISTQFITTANGGVTSIQTVRNAGLSQAPGVEVETSFDVTEELTLSGSLGYVDQKFTNKDPIQVSATTSVVFPGVAPGDPIVLDGLTQGAIPRWNGYAAIDYERDAFNGMTLRAHADASYRGKYFVDLANIAAVHSSWKVNTRIALARDDWEVAFLVRNLLNSHRSAGTGSAGGTTACIFIERDTATYGSNQQCLTSAVQRPREIGLELNWNF